VKRQPSWRPYSDVLSGACQDVLKCGHDTSASWYYIRASACIRIDVLICRSNKKATTTRMLWTLRLRLWLVSHAGVYSDCVRSPLLIADAYSRAIATQLMDSKPDELIPLVLARAGYERRQIAKNENVEEIFLTLVQTLEGAISQVRCTDSSSESKFVLNNYSFPHGRFSFPA
jgi:hypothetical protein